MPWLRTEPASNHLRQCLLFDTSHQTTDSSSGIGSP